MAEPTHDIPPGHQSKDVKDAAKSDFNFNQSGSISPRTLMIGGLAIVFGVSAVIALRVFMQHESGSSNKVSVVMTAEDIPRGITITPEYLTTKEYPKDEVPEGSLTDKTQAIDRVVDIPMIKGEPVLDGKLAPKGSGRGLAAIVKPGMRAMTIQTTNVASGVAGLIMPGDKVDVLMTMNDPGGGNDTTGGGSTITLLTNIEVLAVDQRVNEPTNGKVDPKEMRSVTLLVKPEQANMLDLGQNKGILHLTLRNPGDPDVTKAKTETLNDFRFGQNGNDKRISEASAKTHPSPLVDQLVHDKELIAKYERERPSTPIMRPLPTIRTIRGANEGSISYGEFIATPSRANP